MATRRTAEPAPPARPLRAKGRATRARLLDAGVAVFSRKGFHAARVDDVVREAQTSHGTFYLYFASKDALFEQLVVDVAEEFRTLTESLPVMSRSDPRREELESWLLELIRVHSRYGPLIRSWTEAERGEGATTGQVVLATLAEALASKVRVRSRKAFDPSVASLAVVAMVERVNYFAATGQLEETPEQLASTLAGIVLDALFGPTRPTT